MATKFLDYTGLSYLWGKIKAWCNATFAAITHNHASNAVNAMTGYSKPSSGSAIAVSDSLNSAIGKLEAKVDSIDDSNYVHLTGNETINGLKTFSGTNVNVKNSTLEILNTPSSDKGSSYVIVDKDDNRIACLQYIYRTNGAYDVKMACFHQTNLAGFVALQVGYDENDVWYATAPSTSSLRTNGTDIVTRNWIPSDTRIVHITGKEQIIGQKYFNQYFNVEVPLVRGTVPNEPVYSGFSFYDTSEFAANDGDSARKFGALVNTVGSDGSSHTYMRAYKNVVGGGDSAVLGVVYPASGDPYAVAPSTSTSRNAGTDIVTRDFIPNDTRIVHISAKENVTGDKTFSGVLSVHSNTISLGTAPASATQYLSLQFFSKDHDVAVSSGDDTIGVSRLAEITYAAETNNARRILLVVRKPEAGETSAVGVLGVQYDAGASSPRAYCTSTPDTGFGVDILTRDWIPRDDRIVRVTGTQTITGAKTFSSNVLCNAFRGTATDKKGSVSVEGGSAGTGALVTLYGCQHASYAGQFTVRARASDGTPDRSLTGRPGGTLTWNGQTIQTSSDQRLKTALTAVSDEILDIWEEVEWGEFKFLDAIEEKGDKARVHLGLIAQRVKSVFENHNLDICSYGILCHEEHEATEEESAVDLWMVRYTEALCMEAAYQRRKNKILENRISELERQVSDMLQILQSLKGAN